MRSVVSVLLTATRLKHYVHNEESTLEDALAKMKRLREINLLLSRMLSLLSSLSYSKGSAFDILVNMFY